MQNDFVNSLPYMDFLEIGLSLISLYLNYLRKVLAAMLFAFSSLLLTGTKTIFVFIHEGIGGFKHVGHNDLSEIILFYIVPNSIWILLPLLAVFILGRALLRLDIH